jgi:hypothetical protein
MTTPIYFNIREAREQLCNVGRVYTIRNARQTGLTEARKGSYYKFETLCKVSVEFERLIYITEDKIFETKDRLQKYLSQSGFKTLDEWLSNITKAKMSFMILYSVEALQ